MGVHLRRFSVAIGFVGTAVANTLIGFDISYWSTFLRMVQFGIGRALITKTVHEEDWGKVGIP